jgi:hypothetical protein
MNRTQIRVLYLYDYPNCLYMRIQNLEFMFLVRFGLILQIVRGRFEVQLLRVEAALEKQRYRHNSVWRSEWPAWHLLS